ncbi:4-hydroxybenzoate synthetase (chorismate lyase) [Kingella potus]|uniref:4-hydroxybenzoate synthetase (Chorismate lyase) n=1 Tax=Kingella potus TaxID=265175 RepID=A0A377QYV3_9NEIS|nr:chorismate lyase [Kingella potus]UOP01539.1 chorismate lyase [Kingella potus]STR00172.1 4-hydroxybenzoate synthetase (chorismate lyase) [Kingella potus]
MNTPPLIWQNTLPQPFGPSEHPALARIAAAESLTAALRALPHRFSVNLLHSGTGEAGPLLADGFPQMPQKPFCRDVYLCLDGTPVVWARSQCRPESAFWRNTLDCGTRPLGEILFGGIAGLSRSPLQYALPRPGLLPQASQALLVRRSFFTHQGESLGLAECFLPALAGFLR